MKTAVAVDDVETEWGVRFEDGYIFIANDEGEARDTQKMTDGTLLKREIMPWTEVDVLSR